MSSGMSAAEPTFRWDILMESSPKDTAGTGRLSREDKPQKASWGLCGGGRIRGLPVILAQKGLPGMCLSLYLTRML